MGVDVASHKKHARPLEIAHVREQMACERFKIQLNNAIPMVGQPEDNFGILICKI